MFAAPVIGVQANFFLIAFLLQFYNRWMQLRNKKSSQKSKTRKFSVIISQGMNPLPVKKSLRDNY